MTAEGEVIVNTDYTHTESGQGKPLTKGKIKDFEEKGRENE